MSNKNLFRIILVLLAVTLVTGIFALKKSPLSLVKAADVTADFTDPAFLTCVSTALGTPGSVDSVAAAALTTLDCNWKGILSIAGAEYLINLTQLTLNGNSISSLNPLSGLTKLTTLYISENGFSNISALSGLTNLTQLNLYYNNISNINALSGMTKLSTLDLSDNTINDISALSGLTSLTWLGLDNNPIVELSGLSGLTNLTLLKLFNNNISNLSPIGSGNAALAGFASGNTIDIRNNAQLNGSSGNTAIHEVWLLQANGATVLRNFYFCGNSAVNAGETCDNGVRCSNDNVCANDNACSGIGDNLCKERDYATCDDDCTAIACGDGNLNLPAGEECDDGNLVNGDGCSSACTSEDLTADFTDANFRSCVLTNIITSVNPAATYISIYDAPALTGSLNCAGKNIANINGAEYLTGLTQFYLAWNTITDISPLSGLTGLTELTLQDNDISNITALSGLLNLTRLALSQNTISDLSPLSGLTNLTTLEIEENNLDNTDISNLSGLTKLESLYLGTNNITNLNALSGLTNLARLFLRENDISNISVLSGLTGLMQLSLSSNQISDITPLAGLSGLTTLSLSSNQISDITPLAGLTNLAGLWIGDNDIINISPLAGLTNLAWLWIADNDIINISPLAGLSNITFLELGRNNIENLSPLAGLSDLTLLYLYSNQIINISPLAGLSNLTYLSLALNNIENLSPIGSGNANIAGFASGNTMDIGSNSNLNGTDAIHEVWLLEANGATVSRDFYFCGNSAVNAGETCDNGVRCSNDNACANDNACSGIGDNLCKERDYATCDDDCTAIACGDGNLNLPAGEECDDGGESAACDSNCTNAICGDWTINTTRGEQCDDGNANNNDGCSSTCQNESCGDGIQQTSEGCDDGCIGGIPDNPFGCDLLPLNEGDGCASICQPEVCGDTILVPIEECDDGGESLTCDDDCTAVSCGDSTTNNTAGEQCDDGNGDNTDNCTTFCLDAVCGDSFIWTGFEECDDGGESAACDNDCTNAICVDGKLNLTAGELCDDNNITAGDGCDPSCQPEENKGCKITSDQIVATGATDTFCADLCYNILGYAGGYAPDGEHCVCADQTSADCDAACLTAGGAGHTNAVCQYVQPGGSSSAPPAPVCMASTVKLDLPSALPVSQVGGKPAVTLNWKDISAEDITNLNTRILFDYFSQDKKPTIGTGGKVAENVFARYALGEIAEDADILSAFKTYLGKVSFEGLMDCDCDNDEARYVAAGVRKLMENVTVSAKAKAIVIGFINDLLTLEKILKEAGREAITPFTDFYMANSGVTSTEGVTVNIYRNGNLIHSETNSSSSSYTDDTVPANNSEAVKYYDYYIVTENKCGETSHGSTGQARIDPSVPDGTTVQVSLDLVIKVKEGYSQLFMEKLKELLMANGTAPVQETYQYMQYTEGAHPQEDMCEQMRQAFLTEKKTDMMFSYILECFAGYDYLLRQKLEENKVNIVPPLLKLLQLNEGKETRENIVEHFMYPMISQFNDEIALQMTLKAGISSLNLTSSAVINKAEPGELTEAQMDEIVRNIDEKYFEGAGHAADLVIEKYDADGNLLGTYPAHANVFGIVKGVSAGDMTAGRDYTLKIKLKDAKYTMPKIVQVNVGSAVKTGGIYSTAISLNFIKHFRYGDFNEDGKIDLSDIIAWGGMLGEHPDLWEQANIDGLYGIDLYDIVTLQGNWGGIGDALKEGGTMTLGKLLELFGLTLTSTFWGDSTASVAIPEWLDIVGRGCL